MSAMRSSTVSRPSCTPAATAVLGHGNQLVGVEIGEDRHLFDDVADLPHLAVGHGPVDGRERHHHEDEGLLRGPIDLISWFMRRRPYGSGLDGADKYGLIVALATRGDAFQSSAVDAAARAFIGLRAAFTGAALP